MDDSDYSSDEGNRATALNDPRLPGAEDDSDVDSEFEPDEGFVGRRGGYPGQHQRRFDNNRHQRRPVYLPNDDDPLMEPKRKMAFMHQVFDMLKQPLIIAVVFMLFESNPMHNFAIKTLPIGVSFDGQLDFVGLAILALVAGVLASIACKIVDKQLSLF